VFASIVLARKQRRVEEKTYKDLEWRLTTAMGHFGGYRVNEIDTGVADDFVEAKLHERESIEKAAAAGKPLTETYTDPRTGRTHQRRRRSLSNDSINKVLAGVRQVLKEAKRRRLIDHNPLDDRECFLRSGAPNRSFLEIPQLMAVLEAARQLDQEHRPIDRRDVRAIRSSDEPASTLQGVRHTYSPHPPRRDLDGGPPPRVRPPPRRRDPPPCGPEDPRAVETRPA
jgi:hypothetical protein